MRQLCLELQQLCFFLRHCGWCCDNCEHSNNCDHIKCPVACIKRGRGVCSQLSHVCIGNTAWWFCVGYNVCKIDLFSESTCIEVNNTKENRCNDLSDIAGLKMNNLCNNRSKSSPLNQPSSAQFISWVGKRQIEELSVVIEWCHNWHCLKLILLFEYQEKINYRLVELKDKMLFFQTDSIPSFYRPIKKGEYMGRLVYSVHYSNLPIIRPFASISTSSIDFRVPLMITADPGLIMHASNYKYSVHKLLCNIYYLWYILILLMNYIMITLVIILY